MLIVYLCYAALSVSYQPVVTCCERADLLALLCVLFSCVFFFTFIYVVSGQVWYLSISVPDLLPSSLVSLVQENEFIQIILVICPRWLYAQDSLFKRPKMFILLLDYSTQNGWVCWYL